MLKTSLLEILRTLSKDELKKFDEFVHSPYFNKKSPVIKLWNEIKKYSQDFDDVNLDRKIIWTSLFPGKPFNYGVMKNLIFDLQALSERFIEIEYYSSNEFDRMLNRSEAFISKKLVQRFNKEVRNFFEEFEKKEISVINFYYKYIFERNYQSHLHLFQKHKSEDFAVTSGMNESLIQFFLSAFFNSNYNSVSADELYKKPLDREIIRSVIDFFENSPLKNDIYISMSYHVFKLALNPEEDSSYLKLKTLLTENKKKLSSSLLYNFNLSMINFCNSQILRGKPEYVRDQFEIFKYMIESGNYSFDPDVIDSYMFVNIVSVSSRLGEFHWAIDFMEKFKDKLLPGSREKQLCLAQILFHINKEEYAQALEMLSKIKVTSAIDKIFVKRFQMIIYYELKYFDQLFSLLDSSKHFLSNEKSISEIVKKNFSNFIKFTNRLAEISTDTKQIKLDLSLLKKQISESEVSNKLWFLEKADEQLLRFKI